MCLAGKMGAAGAMSLRSDIELARKTLFFVALLSAAIWITSGRASAASGWHSLDDTSQHAALQNESFQHESRGDLSGARSVLEQAAGTPGNSSGAAALAEFLERHDDPGSRDAYLKWASEESDPAKRKLAL